MRSKGQLIHTTRELDELENQVIAAAKRTVDAGKLEFHL
jgi:hypothetical protein